MQVGGTAGLADLARRGMRFLRELDAILTHQYRSDASLLAAWKGAVRIQRTGPRITIFTEGDAQLEEPQSIPNVEIANRIPATRSIDSGVVLQQGPKVPPDSEFGDCPEAGLNLANEPTPPLPFDDAPAPA
jgi:hypothetical protein